MILWRRRKKLS